MSAVKVDLKDGEFDFRAEKVKLPSQQTAVKQFSCDLKYVRLSPLKSFGSIVMLAAPNPDPDAANSMILAKSDLKIPIDWEYYNNRPEF